MGGGALSVRRVKFPGCLTIESIGSEQEYIKRQNVEKTIRSKSRLTGHHLPCSKLRSDGGSQEYCGPGFLSPQGKNSRFHSRVMYPGSFVL